MAKPAKKRASRKTPRAIPLAKATEQRARLASAQADLAVAELKAILGLLSGLQKATETGWSREPLPPKSQANPSPNIGGTLPLTVGEPKKQQATHGDPKASLKRAPRAVPLAKAAEQRARLASAQADLAELKAAERRGELLDAAGVERTWGGVLRTVPSRVGARPPHLTAADIDEVDKEIRAVLTDVGSGSSAADE
jgi:phage terminase Nu1 subunit (DNA packaging protein)